MGSSAQVIVGGMLLVTAFLFGRYINEQPLVPGQAIDAVSDLVKNDLPLKPIQASSVPKPFSFSLAKKEQPAAKPVATPELVKAPELAKPPVVKQDSNALQRSLRDRILGERQNRLKDQGRINEPLANKDELRSDFRGSFTTPDSSFDQAIGVPDFSHLENGGLADESFQNNKFVPIEIPTFDSLRDDAALADVPFNDTSGVIVGPMPDLAEEMDYRKAARNVRNELPPMPRRDTRNNRETRRFEPLAQVTPSGRQAQSLPKAGSLDQSNYGLMEKRKKQKQIRTTSRGSFELTNQDLVPVRHRESRLTTEVTKFVDYTTVFGDTLHGISFHFFGKPNYYLDIYLANKEKFENPAKVPVNTKLRIPVMSKLINQR